MSPPACTHTWSAPGSVSGAGGAGDPGPRLRITWDHNMVNTQGRPDDCLLSTDLRLQAPGAGPALASCSRLVTRRLSSGLRLRLRRLTSPVAITPNPVLVSPIPGNIHTAYTTLISPIAEFICIL